MKRADSQARVSQPWLQALSHGSSKAALPPAQVLTRLLLCLQGDGTETGHSRPQEGPYWSLMFEVSESELKAVNNEVESFAGGRWAGIVRECVQGALNTKLIQIDSQIVSLYHRWAWQFPSPCLWQGRSVPRWHVLPQGRSSNQHEVPFPMRACLRGR